MNEYIAEKIQEHERHSALMRDEEYKELFEELKTLNDRIEVVSRLISEKKNSINFSVHIAYPKGDK